MARDSRTVRHMELVYLQVCLIAGYPLQVKPQSATAAPSKPLMEEANDIFDVFSKPSTPAAAPFAPPARTGAAASPFGGA